MVEAAVAPKFPSLEKFKRKQRRDWEKKSHPELVTEDEYLEAINQLKATARGSGNCEILEPFKTEASVIVTRFWREKLQMLLKLQKYPKEEPIREGENKLTFRWYRPIRAVIYNELAAA